MIRLLQTGFPQTSQGEEVYQIALYDHLGQEYLFDQAERFNAFNITVNSYFTGKLPGEWSYQIYEQTSTSNLIPSQATSMVESGQATLNDTSQFSFTTYSNQTNTYKVRDI